MAGASLTIDIDDRAVTDALRELQRRGEDLQPALRDMGEYLLIAHRHHFEQERAPDGTPWAPLADATILARMRRGVKKPKEGRRSLRTQAGNTKAGAIGVLARLKILQDSGNLRDALRYQVSESALEFGTDRIYGASHQFGRGAIPARPYLGLSSGDERELLDIVAGYLAGAAP